MDIWTAHENGCAWNEGTSEAAAERGNLVCLKYIHENGCPWDGATCEWASTIECAMYAHDNGCRCCERPQRCSLVKFGIKKL